LYLGAVEVKSISRRVSRAMIKGAATAQKAAANLIASTRRVVPFNYMRGGHPHPELPTTHQTPHSPTFSRTLRLFLFFPIPGYSGEFFNFTRCPKEKGVSTTATENRSQLIVIVRGVFSESGDIH